MKKMKEREDGDVAENKEKRAKPQERKQRESSKRIKLTFFFFLFLECNKASMTNQPLIFGDS